MERAEVKVSSQPKVSTQLEVPSAQEERMEMQQSGSPSVLMLTSRVAEPNPTTGLISVKVSIIKVPST